MLGWLRVDWSIILETEKIVISDKDSAEKRRRIAGAFKELLLHRSQATIEGSQPDGSQTDFLFLKSMPRDDYDKLFQEICSTAPHEAKCIADVRTATTPSTSLYGLYILLRYAAVALRIRAGSVLDWLFLFTRAIRTLEAYTKVRRLKFDHLVVFADMQMLDNLMVQIANRANKPTTTMQHGLYIDYSNNFNVNITNYKNHIAKNFLAWGRETAKLIEKYHPESNTVVCGRPIGLPAKTETSTASYITLICDQNMFFAYNLELLQIGYEFARSKGLMLNLRMHPNNRLEWFRIDESLTLVNEDLMSSELVIGHTSTLLYECLKAGLPTFKYRSPIPSNQTRDELCFSDCDELLEVSEKLRSRTDELKQWGAFYIDTIGEESASNYKLFFEKQAELLRSSPANLEKIHAH